MSRRVQTIWAVLTSIMIAVTGCAPQQPFYFMEDGDLSHYVDTATNIEYPDTEVESLDEVRGSKSPLTLDNTKPCEMWDLCLEEAIQISLANSKVMRTLGGRLLSTQQQQPPVGGPPENLLGYNRGPQGTPPPVQTVYDAAIIESVPRQGSLADGRQGVEAALSAFDAQWRTSTLWTKNDRPQNVRGGIVDQFFTPTFLQDLGVVTSEISKITATGGRFGMAMTTTYDNNNNPTRQIPSDWTQNFEFGFAQPLLARSGVQYNRIMGPGTPIPGAGSELGNLGLNGSFGDVNQGRSSGVMLARINTDIALTSFEGGVRNLVADVENSYWDLYFDYRNLEATKAARASALQTWKKIHALYVVGAKGGEAEKEAQSREQYFFFRSQVQSALNSLYREENRLRFMMGLTVADGRLIRPSCEPTTAKVTFDWNEIHMEGLARSPELRARKWQIKADELVLIGNKNLLLPALDAIGRYRFLGLGDDLITASRHGEPANGLLDGTTAFQSLTDGQYQEWALGLQLTIPIGYRNALAAVRNAQLVLARDRAIIQEAELELSHEIADALRNLESNYHLSQTNFNRRVAAERQVEAVQAAFEAETVTLDLLLDAQRRRADAEIAYYRSLTDYSRSIAQIHYRKGSLLEYNSIYLAEGPWPAKAQFDAYKLARQRDASFYLDYGYTRPKVISQGPYLQHAGDANNGGDGVPMPATEGESELSPEVLPTPTPANEEIPVPAARRGEGPLARQRATETGPLLKQPQVLKAKPSGASDPQVAAKPASSGSVVKASAVKSQEAASTGPSRSALKRPAQQPVQRAAFAEEANPQPRAERANYEWKSKSTHEANADTATRAVDRPAAVWKGAQR